MIWFCAFTDPFRERDVAMRIRTNAGLMAYLPMEPIMRKVRGKREPATRPLIPRHVFWATENPDATTYAAVRSLRNVRALLSLSFDRSPSPLRARDIEAFADVVEDMQRRFDRRWQRQQEEEKRKDDTTSFVERLAQAPPHERPGLLLQLIGRGKKARLKLEDAQQLVRADLRTAA